MKMRRTKVEMKMDKATSNLTAITVISQNKTMRTHKSLTRMKTSPSLNLAKAFWIRKSLKTIKKKVNPQTNNRKTLSLTQNLLQKRK